MCLGIFFYGLLGSYLMRTKLYHRGFFLTTLLAASWAMLGFAQEPAPLAQPWEYDQAMQAVAGRFTGKPGVVLHLGDSITYSSPYGQWARFGKGHSEADKTLLKWLHCGAEDETDGWYLARFDHPDGGRSYTAASGLRADELLAGGKRNLPPLADLLKKYQPQIVVLMIGTNDATAKRKVEEYQKDLAKICDAILAADAIPLVSTIPPHPRQEKLAAQFNEQVRAVTRERRLPLIDYEREILLRRPRDWNGALLAKDDVHPTAQAGDISASSPPTEKNLAACGYLLRGWLSVRKIGEVKRTVIDRVKPGQRPVENRPAVSAAGKRFMSRPPIPKPMGEQVRCPVTRDARFSSVGEEVNWNMGGASQLKFKSTQEMSLIDIDPAPLRGRVINGATLYLKRTGDEILHRVTVSSLASDWVEGTGSESQPQPGGSCFAWKKYPDVPWAGPGSDLTAVTLGNGGTLWRMADAFPPDPEGWQKIAIEPAIIAERVAGRSHGFLVFDDTGSEWTRDGEKFTYRIFPNRFAFSREGGRGNEPYLVVWLGDKSAAEEPPRKTAPSPISTDPKISLPKPPWQPFAAVGPLPKIGGAEIAIIDQLDKLHPVTGKLIPAGKDDDARLAANHIWSAREKRIRLQGAGNEFVGFQIVVRGKIANLKTEVDFEPGDDRAAAPQVAFFLPRYVASDAGPVPDPLVPCAGLLSVPARASAVEGQTAETLYCEIYLPSPAAGKEIRGLLRLTAGQEKLELPISLTVFAFRLPNQLTFLAEMNCYGLPDNERDYYRLAHRHRLALNRVPYSQSGQVHEGCAPIWNGKELDWSKWDQRFGPLLDGSAFADLPRGGVPLEIFYLPLHENWPLPINDHYNGGYWADEALTPEYRQAFVEVSRQFHRHASEKKWHRTLLQCFLNNKVDFKRRGWSRGSSPWLLDEPNHFQDFWALRFFGEAFHEGVKLGRQGNKPGAGPSFAYRCDISRPQWQRDSLTHVLDYNVVSSSAWKQYGGRDGVWKIVYGEANSPATSNVQAAAWCWDAALHGAHGVLPWQTIGNAESWKQADPTALFYPGESIGLKEPVPSLRLKAFLRGQQDAEYLHLLATNTAGESSPLSQLSRQLALTGVRQKTAGVEYAGRLDYGLIGASDLWRVRGLAAAMIGSQPQEDDKFHWSPPDRPRTASNPGYVSVGEAPPPK